MLNLESFVHIEDQILILLHLINNKCKRTFIFYSLSIVQRRSAEGHICTVDHYFAYFSTLIACVSPLKGFIISPLALGFKFVDSYVLVSHPIGSISLYSYSEIIVTVKPSVGNNVTPLGNNVTPPFHLSPLLSTLSTLVFCCSFARSQFDFLLICTLFDIVLCVLSCSFCLCVVKQLFQCCSFSRDCLLGLEFNFLGCYSMRLDLKPIERQLLHHVCDLLIAFLSVMF